MHQLRHLANRLIQSNKDSARNDTVADIELMQLWNLSYRFNVVVVQTMAGVDNQAFAEGVFRG